MFLKIVLPILLILSIGLVSRKVDLLNAPRVELLNKIAFYIALPALVFHSIHSRPFGEIWAPTLVIGFLTVLFLTFGIGWFAFRNMDDNSKRSVATAQSYHGNLGYMGLPIVAMVLGGAAGAKASLLLGLGSITQIPLTMSLLVRLNNPKTRPIDQLKRIVANPVLLALIVGLSFSLLQLSVPSEIDEPISFLAKTALPIALLGVGASIRLRKRGENPKVLSSVAGLKMITMPVLGWIILSTLSVGSLSLKTGILMLGMPTAVSTFVYSKELGGDEKFASLNISTTTIISMLTISALLILLS